MTDVTEESMLALFEHTKEWYLKNWPKTRKLWPRLDKYVAEGRLDKSDRGEGWFRYLDGEEVHVVTLQRMLDGWSPETLQAGQYFANDATAPANAHPDYLDATADSPDKPSSTMHYSQAAFSALFRDAKEFAQRTEAAKSLNDEKQHTAADRLALGRRLYVDRMSETDLMKAYAEQGEFISKATAGRDLKKIRD